MVEKGFAFLALGYFFCWYFDYILYGINVHISWHAKCVLQNNTEINIWDINF